MLLTNSITADLVTLLIGGVILLIYFVRWKFAHWKSRGLLSPKTTFLFGNMLDLVKQKETFGDHIRAVYTFLKNKKQVHGGEYFFLMPIYVPIDPEIVKSIMQNDFASFMDRGIYFNEKDPLTCNLFFIEGTKWKKLRAKLTPTFTSGKMKMMFEALLDCSKQLTIEMDKTVDKPIEVKDILGRFTTDIIGSVAFGIECNSLSTPNSDFRLYGSKFFTNDLYENFKSILTFIMPEVMRKFGTKVVPHDVSDFFLKVIKDTVEYREKNNIIRKDFMHLLIQLKNTGKLEDENLNTEDEKLSFNELAAQAFVFFIAGFETSSTTMTFALYLLASNTDIQDKLRQEVVEVLKKHNGELTYEAVMEMTYMDKVINETLRMYPPLPTLNRICTKDYKVPGTEVLLEKGTKVTIPVIALQYDEEYYPNPTKFDPERFSEENKRTRHPYTFLPFGDGPRICIGERFGKMQTKVGLTVLLKNYKFTVNSKTIIPLEMDTRSFIPSTKGGMWMNYKKVDNTD